MMRSETRTLCSSVRLPSLSLSPHPIAWSSSNPRAPAYDDHSDLARRQGATLINPADMEARATKDIAGAMNAILADVFALYLKTKTFHGHMSRSHFRDYHLLLDEQGASTLRHDRLNCRTHPQGRRGDDPINWPYRRYATRIGSVLLVHQERIPQRVQAGHPRRCVVSGQSNSTTSSGSMGVPSRAIPFHV